MFASAPLQTAASTDDRVSIDTMFTDGVDIAQRANGQRFTLDAILLAHRAARHMPRHALEIGAGNGAVSLGVAWLTGALGPSPSHSMTIDAVEVQPGLAERMRSNIARNGADGVVLPHHADACSLWRDDAAGQYDVVLLNPPWFALGRGRLSPDAERAGSRHALHGSAADLIAAAARAVKPTGVVEVAFTGRRRAELLRWLADAGLGDIELTLVRATHGAQPFLLLAAAQRGPQSELRRGADIVQYAENGDVTPHFEALIAGTGRLEVP